MKTEGRIFSNAIILTSGEFVGQLANFLFVIAFARQFGAERLGQFSLAMSVGASICIFVSLGVHALLTREIGQDPARGQAVIGNWLPVGLGSALTVWTVLALATWLLPIGRDLQVMLLIIGAYQIIWQFGAVFALQFSARGLMVIPSLSNAINRPIILALGGSAMMLHAGATTVLLALPIVTAVTVCVVAWQARRAFGAPNLQWDVPIIISLITRARSFFTMSVLGVVQGRIGIILLAAIAGNTTVGMYAAADRLLLPVILVEMLLIKAAYPAMLRLWASDRERMCEVSTRCLRFVLLISIPISGSIFALRADLVPLVYGENFDSAIAPLAILAWLPIFAGMRALWDAHAITAHLQRHAAVAQTIAIVVLISGATLAINRHQATGLAVAVLAAEAVHAALLFVLLARHDMVPAVARPLIGPACAAAVAILSSMTVVEQGFLLRTSVVVGVMILGLWLFGGIRMHDVRFLADALNKQSHVS